MQKEKKLKKMKPIDPYSEEWEHEADIIARGACPRIYPCGNCQYPVVSGYCCTYCGTSNPEQNGAEYD